MYLYNSKSRLYCKTEEEELQHENEINFFFSKLTTLPDYECALLRKYQDKYHENIPQKVIPTTLHQILEDLEGEDLKNGIDIVIDDEYFIVVAYGSGYTANNGECGIDTVALKIIPYNDNRDFLNITSAIIDGNCVTVAKEQFDASSHLFS